MYIKVDLADQLCLNFIVIPNFVSLQHFIFNRNKMKYKKKI